MSIYYKIIVLILEDDIKFYSNYSKIYDVINEIERRDLKNFIISLEDSALKYIPKSKRIKGNMLYHAKETRMSGAYLIDKIAAKNILNFVKVNKIHLPIDWYLNFCIEKNVVNMFWSEPTLCIQTSLSGEMQSLIDKKKTGIIRGLNIKLQRLYKHILYFFR